MVYDLYLGSAADNLAKEGETSGKEFSPDGLTCNTTYYWQVVAKNESSQKASDIWSFTTDAELKVSLSSPNDQEVVSDSSSITLVWGGNAESYDLYVGEDENSLSLKESGLTEESYNLTGLKKSTGYYWKVVAKGKFENKESSIQYFKTRGDVFVELEYPEDGAEEQETNLLVWDGGDGNDEGYKYDIYFGQSPDDLNCVFEDCEEEKCRVSFGKGITYYWKVVGKKDGVEGGSSVWSFTSKSDLVVASTSPGLGEDVYSNKVTFEWDGTADEYDFWLGTTETVMEKIDSGLVGLEHQVDLKYDKQYFWKVVGRDANSECVSLTKNFNTIKPSLTLSAPTDNADTESIMPELSWSGVGVSSYTVWMGTSKDNMEVKVSGLTGISYFLDQLELNQTYYWQVVGKDDENNQVESEVRSFITELGTYTNTIGMEMVRVKAGTFLMGNEDYASPVHSVTISQDYYIGKCEVTNADVVAVFNWAKNNVNGVNFSESSVTYGGNELLDLNAWSCQIGLSGGSLCVESGKDDFPVIEISWYGAAAFADFLNQKEGVNKYSLPTEAQWEFAARGGNRSNGYTYAGSNTLGDVAWYCENFDCKFHEVGTKLANELGLYDMSGNVKEWCNDWYGGYLSEAVTDPQGRNTDYYRVLRGGGWGSDARSCSVAYRSYGLPSASSSHIGFRLICSP